MTEVSFFERARNSAQHDFAAIKGAASEECGSLSGGTVYPLVFPNAAKTRRQNFLIAARDLNSLVQHVADSILVIGLSFIAEAVYHTAFQDTAFSFRISATVGLVVATAFAAMVRVVTANRNAVITNTYDRLRDAALAWTLAFATLTFGLFVAKAGGEASRGAVLIFYFAGLPAIALWRVFSPVAIAPKVKRAGASARECIVIGDQSDAVVDTFASELLAKGHPEPTIFKFRAFCPSSVWQAELGHLADSVAQVARRSAPGEIFICAGSIPGDRLAALGRRLNVLPRAIFIIPDAQTASLVRCRSANLGGHVVLEARREPLSQAQRAIKRVMDVVIAGAALILLAPLLLLVAAMIKLDSKGPVLFCQTRNGYRGRPFQIFKFRSMRVLENGPLVVQATRQDPRVTRIGRYLRKLSIDELPQLVNILLGDMSLVGPRPHALAHDELYARSIENYEVRQHVKPGLTGWAQVNGLRGETATIDAMNKRIEYDLWYAVNASVLLDIEILVRTAIEVARSRNAY